MTADRSVAQTPFALSSPEVEIHPVANIFPPMSASEFDALRADIREHGLREAIWLSDDGRIIDGRHRYRACVLEGVEPRYQVWDGSDSLVAFVVSLNLHRRHLDESQRALVVGRIAKIPHGGDRRSEQFQDSNLNLEDAAALMNVGRTTASYGKKVVEAGSPELVQAVESGKVAVSTAAVIAEAPQEQQREIVARGERAILEAAKQIRAQKLEERRQERVEKLAEIAKGGSPLAVAQKYPIIYADPPWRYEHVETESRAIENQYPTMALDDICALPLPTVTTDDAVLFLWATSPKLAEAMRVVEAWGFTYRTCMVWVKEQIGMGYYARQQHELLLICTKGQPPTPAPSDRPASVVRAPRTEHSAKPPEFYGLIERMYPTLPKIELFSRSPRDGWAAWGNQA